MIRILNVEDFAVQKDFRPWLRLVFPFSVTYLAIGLLTRIGLLIYSGQAGEATWWQWPAMFAWGFVFDLQVLGLFLLPVLIIHLLARPQAWQGRGLYITRMIFLAAFTYTWLFTAVSEFFFWEEFSARFNFIAVDYLVYTTEVIGNIRESYPINALLAGIGAVTALIAWSWRKAVRLSEALPTGRMGGLALAAIPVLMLFVFNTGQIHVGANQAIQEVSMNGTYNLFSAYRNNELDYHKFYITHDEKQIAAKMRELLEEDESDFVSADPEDITRVIRRKGPEIHKNVVLVVMESMSADFMTRFGNPNALTPNMDALTKTGLFFSNMYATGTRTVRGLEAITLSVPPTPGQSIVRRPGNENLFSLGFVFQDRGYDTAFIYGGHGYFDNMNAFFAGNGFRIVDRTDFADSDITFSNVWGVSDEDLYRQVMRQADAAYARKQPFMYEVMTTSNHRPFTFPEGIPGIPAKNGGRKAGAKYADYAVGQFLAAAQSKPWFKDTVFVFVADHTAGAGGKIDLSLQKYHIPAIFYAPGFIKPQEYTHVSSQIDVAPVLLGLLNFSYYTKFYGEDLLNDADEIDNAHAFISNYQKLAYIEDGQLTVLEPLEKSEFFAGEEPMDAHKVDLTLLTDTVTYYQYASGWKERMRRIPTVVKK